MLSAEFPLWAADPSGSWRTLAATGGPWRTLADPGGPCRPLADPGFLWPSAERYPRNSVGSSEFLWKYALHTQEHPDQFPCHNTKWRWYLLPVVPLLPPFAAFSAFCRLFRVFQRLFSASCNAFATPLQRLLQRVFHTFFHKRFQQNAKAISTEC